MDAGRRPLSPLDTKIHRLSEVPGNPGAVAALPRAGSTQRCSLPGKVISAESPSPPLKHCAELVQNSSFCDVRPPWRDSLFTYPLQRLKTANHFMSSFSARHLRTSAARLGGRDRNDPKSRLAISTFLFMHFLKIYH